MSNKSRRPSLFNFGRKAKKNRNSKKTRRSMTQRLSQVEQLEHRRVLAPVTVMADVTATGLISITANDSAIFGDDLTVDPGIKVEATAGSVDLNAGDDLRLQAGSIVKANQDLNLNVDFGNADPGIDLATLTLANATIEATNGKITVTGDSDPDEFIFDGTVIGDITIRGNGGSDITRLINFGGGTDSLTIDGDATDRVAIGVGGPASFSFGDMNFLGGGKLLYQIDGKTAGTGYDQIVSSGTVELDNAILDLDFPSFTPSIGDSFVLIDSTSGITGNFAGLPEGSILSNFGGSGFDAKITYQGGVDGKDAVITVFGLDAVDDDYTSTNPITEDAKLTIPDGGTDLFANDIGTKIGLITFDGKSANGAAVTVNKDGSFTYDPTSSSTIQALDEGAMLTDTFTYAITDSTPPDGLMNVQVINASGTVPTNNTANWLNVWDALDGGAGPTAVSLGSTSLTTLLIPKSCLTTKVAVTLASTIK